MEEPYLKLIESAAIDLAEAVDCNNQTQLDEVISALTKLLTSPFQDQSITASVLLQLQFAHYMRYRWLDESKDLELGIEYTQKARRLASFDNYDRVRADVNYCGLLRARFDRYGRQTDIDEAIKVAHNSLNRMRKEHPDRHALLSNLGDAYWSRFRVSRDARDLRRASAVKSEALRLLPEGNERWTVIAGDLATEYTELFLISGRIADADQAIDFYHRRIANTEGHNELFLMNANIASLLIERFKVQHNVADIEEALGRSRIAIELIDKGDSQRSMAMKILINALSARYEHSRNNNDLMELIEATKVDNG
jgi:hypothetical protein